MERHKIRVGMRIIKTVVAVFLCGLLAWVRQQSAFYSMIAAIICMQNSTGKTIQSSVNRAIATLIGGTAGVAMVALMDALGVLDRELVRYAVIAVMLIPLIQITLLIKRPAISAFTCVVFLCVTVNHSVGEAPAFYAIERTFETLIGVALACAVDLILPYHTQAPEQPPAPPDPPEEGGRP